MQLLAPYVLILLVPGAIAWGVEYELASEPLSATAATINSKEFVAVDWGAVAPAIARSGVDVEQSVKQFKDYLKGPEFTAFYKQAEKEAGAKERKLAKEKWEAIDLAYRTQSQDPGFPMLPGKDERTLPLDPWEQRWPADVRKSLRFAIVDLRNTEQVEWAVAQSTRYDFIEVIAIGWSSQADIERIIKEHPILSRIGKVRDSDVPGSEEKTARDWALRLHITGLPALIDFPEGLHLHITEGLTP